MGYTKKIFYPDCYYGLLWMGYPNNAHNSQLFLFHESSYRSGVIRKLCIIDRVIIKNNNKKHSLSRHLFLPETFLKSKTNKVNDTNPRTRSVNEKVESQE